MPMPLSLGGENSILLTHSDGHLEGFTIRNEKKGHRGIYPLRFLTLNLPHHDTINILTIQSPARALPEFAHLFTPDGNWADKYIENWRIAKEAGLPVAEEIMRVSDTEVAMYDVLQKGSVSLYGNLEEEAITEGETDFPLGSSQTNKLMAKLDMNLFEHTVDKLVEKATEAHIQLPPKDVHLMMDIDGTWQLFILNCTETELSDAPNLNTRNHNMGILLKSYIYSVYYYLQRNPPQ